MQFDVSVIDAATNSTLGKSQISERSNPIAGGWTIGGVDKGVPPQVGANIAGFVIFAAKRN